MDEELQRLISDGDLELTVAQPVPGRVTLTISDGAVSRSFGPSVEADAMRNAVAWMRHRLASA
jgi:hypothetical protein